MKICYLGQQGWLISKGSTNVLVDPVLTETFGTSNKLKFRIYPPRAMDLEKMPSISAVVITNEHLDHFHLPSIKRLERSIPIYVGELMPLCVKKSITEMGFNLVILKNQESVTLGKLVINLFIGNKNTPFWEKRVYQLYCRNTQQLNQGGVYIQSDTLMSDYFLKQIKAKILPSPMVYITTNNAQVVPDDVLGAFDNLLPIEAEQNTGLTGLKILDEILIQYPKSLSIPKHLLISGGGYIQESAPFGPFLFSDYKRLAELANKLSLDTKVHGLLPGEELDISTDTTSEAGWIKKDYQKWQSYIDSSINYSESYNPLLSNPVFNPFTNDEDIKVSLKNIENELIFMSKVLICSKLGIELTSANEYMNGSTGATGFVFNIRTGLNDLTYQYGLDLRNGKFIKLASIPFEDLIREYPYGVDVFLEDLCALLDGDIQIWELATANMRQWYLGTKMESPVAFLYKYFSEQVRQDLANKVYKNLYAQ
jgi:hypothetical protein